MNVASVSVLVPCRNAEAYVRETLASALEQSLPPLEILVVDDGSADRSREIVSSFAPRVRLLDNDGSGASAARNLATRAARGEFLQYLDADDVLEPHALASRVDALERTGAGVAISDWVRLQEHDGTWRETRIECGQVPSGDEPADLKVFRGFWAPPAAILYRRSVVERVGGWHPGLPVIQDARFLLDAAGVAGGFVHVAGVGARYRQHRGGSLSSRDAVGFWKDVLANTSDVERQWRTAGKLDGPHRAALADAYGLCARFGFVRDWGLYQESERQLSRFPEYRHPRFLVAARRLTRILGHRPARLAMAPFCRS
jgi:glycosyltransferase involved in cell wall biosynthesis